MNCAAHCLQLCVISVVNSSCSFGVLKHMEVKENDSEDLRYLLIVKLEVGGIWMTLILQISKYLQQLWIFGTKP